MAKKWSREELIRVFEILLEKQSPLLSYPAFREQLTRDENLVVNQLTREANGNLAYQTVDFEIGDNMPDEAFWAKVQATPYRELIEENAALAMMKMAEKLKLF